MNCWAMTPITPIPKLGNTVVKIQASKKKKLWDINPIAPNVNFWQGWLVQAVKHWIKLFRFSYISPSMMSISSVRHVAIPSVAQHPMRSLTFSNPIIRKLFIMAKIARVLLGLNKPSWSACHTIRVVKIGFCAKRCYFWLGFVIVTSKRMYTIILMSAWHIHR